MPFVYDLEPFLEPPVKRRKLCSTMARYSTPKHEDNDEEQFPFEPTETSVESGGPPQEETGENEEVTVRTSDREELIQCIKRGQRTTWVPKPGLEALCAEVTAEQNASSASTVLSPDEQRPADRGSRSGMGTHEVKTTRQVPPSAADSLRRSLSSLRTGDLGDDMNHHTMMLSLGPLEVHTPTRQHFQPEYAASPPFWQAESPSVPSLPRQQSSPSDMLRRSRAPSLGSSLSSSFVMRIPTSPLVHATNNPALDFSPRNGQNSQPSRSARRRTLPPNAFETLHMSPLDNAMPNFSRPLPYFQPLQPAGSSHAQGHRPRRSLSSFTYQPASMPQLPPWARQRRPSLAADTPPRQRASMVGSFEESILRGRMSTPPSKPFDFVAQIGVMGKGNCPASLKCPAHVTVPFPAVFYNYPSANASRSISDDNPSPYVGNVDLENNMKAPDEARRRSRRLEASLDPEELAAEITNPENTPIGKALSKEARERKEQTSGSPKCPSGGAYRVPQTGQLQLIIKNPNKTAVKLFLVPYDLEGMLPGTKTFVRQRSYSSGPILEAATLEKQVDLAARDPLITKDILRYLVHLKFCCTAKGRFYLYENIRVVFANRVPDGKEKLRSEVQLPEPRFSPYRPAVAHHARNPSIADEKLCSLSQNSLTPDFQRLDEMSGSADIRNHSNEPRQVPPIAFHLPPTSTTDHVSTKVVQTPWKEDEEGSSLERTVSPTPGFLPSTSSRSSPVPWPASSGSSISRGFSPAPVESGHGLLSRKLRGLNGQPESN